MTFVRRRLSLWVTLWLVFQAASLSAFVPRDCCAAHRPARSEPEPPACHEAAAVPHCELHEPAPPCPMHAARPSPDTAGKCSLKGTCGGPMTTMVALLATYGVLTHAADLTPGTVWLALPSPAAEILLARRTPPDAPPPRA